MGFMSRMLDRIEARIEHPADQSVLDGNRSQGSESVRRAEDEDAVAAARRARRERARRRWRWGSGG